MSKPYHAGSEHWRGCYDILLRIHYGAQWSIVYCNSYVILIVRVIRGNAPSRAPCVLWKGLRERQTLQTNRSRRRKFNYLLLTLMHYVDTIISLNLIFVIQSLIIGTIKRTNYFVVAEHVFTAHDLLLATEIKVMSFSNINHRSTTDVRIETCF